LDVSFDRKFVVTGLGKKVDCWNLKREKVMEIELKTGLVSKVALSPCGRYLSVVDKKTEKGSGHRVTIYNFSTQKPLMSYSSSFDQIKDLAWSRRLDDLRFATATVKEVKFWHPADFTKELVQQGKLMKDFERTEFHCFAFDEEGWGFSGCENGQIYVWSDKCEVVKAIMVPNKRIVAIKAQEGMLIAGSIDKKIAVISVQGFGSFKLERVISVDGVPSSIDLYKGCLLLGTDAGTLLE